MLTWSAKNGGRQIPKAKAVHMITKAFKLWSAACDIRFKQVQKNPDIEISFESRGHGDGNYFDGRGGKYRKNLQFIRTPLFCWTSILMIFRSV